MLEVLPASIHIYVGAHLLLMLTPIEHQSGHHQEYGFIIPGSDLTSLTLDFGTKLSRRLTGYKALLPWRCADELLYCGARV